MNFFDKITKNFVFSFPHSPNSDLWKFFVYNFGPVLMTVFFTTLIVGVYAGKKGRLAFGMPKKWVILLVVASIISVCFSFFQLYQRTLNFLFLVLFCTVFIYWTLFLGNKLGIKLALFLKRPGGLVKVFIVFGVGLFMYVFFLSSSISFDFSKEGLRSTYKSIFGRTPGDSEKKAFWGGVVGDEKPSETKKEEYWDE